MNADLQKYYNERAAEYDNVYKIPCEQNDLLEATELFQKIFSGKSVLEIACGTGYWTEKISKTASSILATDINKSVIDIAKAKNVNCDVKFEVIDMNYLNTKNQFDGLFGGFIWSHILVQELDKLLCILIDQILPGGDIVFIDSKPVQGTSHDNRRIVMTDEHGNTFQKRHLENGTSHKVLKNFPPQNFLFDKLSQFANKIQFYDLEYYWIATCKKL